MATRRSENVSHFLNSLPPLPFDDDHWQAVCDAMQLSSQQAKVVALVLRSASDKQIADAMNLSEETIKTYLSRIAQRTGTRGRMQLAMHVLAVSHQVPNNGCCEVAECPRFR